jgi:hypothetical protein
MQAFGCFDNNNGSRLGVAVSPNGVDWSTPVQVGAKVLGNRTGGDTYNNLAADFGGGYLAATRVDVGGVRSSAVSMVPPGGLLHPLQWPSASIALNNGADNTTLEVYGLKPFRYGHLWLGFVVDYEVRTCSLGLCVCVCV